MEMICDGAGRCPLALPRRIFGKMKMGDAFMRRAVPEDAGACAAMKNDWIDTSDWMSRIHDADDVECHYRDFIFAKRDVWVTGDPVAGFLALDVDCAEVTALFVARPGHGVGKALLDHAKADRDHSELWTFMANEGARRFYAREGFFEVRRTVGENEEGLPDVLLRWERS